MINDEYFKSIHETFLNSHKYSFNKCFKYYKNSKLSDFKKCLLACNNFQDKKFEFLENYLIQIDNIIEGNKINLEFKEEIENSTQPEDRYILPEHFYRSNALEANQQPTNSVGAIFGRNR